MVSSGEAVRPKSVGLAVALLWFAFAGGIAWMAERPSPSASYLPLPVFYGMFAVAYALLASLVFLVFRGYDWARITCVSLIGVRSVIAFSRASSEFGSDSTAAAISLGLASVEFLAACLLLSRPSRAWFRRSRK
jgi:hypothetical protein